MRKTKGFTLIELLVVIAIISLLVSILLPSLQKARDLAKNVVCMTTLRSHGAAFSFYISDNDDWLPVFGYSGNEPWFFRIMPYIDDGELPLGNSMVSDIALKTFMCPMEDDPHNYVSIHTLSYGMNQNGWQRIALSIAKIDEVVDAGGTVMTGDSGGRTPQVPMERAWIRPGLSTHALNGGWEPDFPGRHGENANVLWVDAHVSTENAQDVTVDKKLWDRSGDGYQEDLNN